MVKAVWNDTVIAESDDTVVVENNHYFPLDAVTPGLLTPSARRACARGRGPRATTP